MVAWEPSGWWGKGGWARAGTVERVNSCRALLCLTRRDQHRTQGQLGWARAALARNPGLVSGNLVMTTWAPLFFLADGISIVFT